VGKQDWGNRSKPQVRPWNRLRRRAFSTRKGRGFVPLRKGKARLSRSPARKFGSTGEPKTAEGKGRVIIRDSGSRGLGKHSSEKGWSKTRAKSKAEKGGFTTCVAGVDLKQQTKGSEKREGSLRGGESRRGTGGKTYIRKGPDLKIISNIGRDKDLPGNEERFRHGVMKSWFK